MKTAVRLFVFAALVAGASLATSTTTARPAPGADLQITAGGQDGIARAPQLCRRNFEGCSTSTIHQCKC